VEQIRSELKEDVAAAAYALFDSSVKLHRDSSEDTLAVVAGNQAAALAEVEEKREEMRTLLEEARACQQRLADIDKERARVAKVSR